MRFTAIFIAFLLERFVVYNATTLRNWSWFSPYQRMIADKLTGQSPYVLLAAIVLPIVLLLFVVAELVIHTFVFGFLKLFLSIAIVFYCFGPRNLWADVMSCLNAFTENDTAQLAEKLKVTFDIPAGGDKQTLHRELLTRVFTQVNARVFGVMFWFGIMGVLGVVVYRLIAQVADEKGADGTSSAVSATARQILGYLDWPSVRALTFLFALGGNFGRVFAAWMGKVMQGPEANEALLLECGMASLNSAARETLPIDGSAEKEQIAVIDRSIAIALVVIAVLVFLIP